MEIVVAPQDELSPSLRAQVVALHERAWPGGGDDGHDLELAPLSMVLLDGEDVVAALDILTKDLVHAGQRYRASGLSTVVTDPERRHRGWGLELIRAAFERIAASNVDLAVFTCDEPLAPFYERAGFELLPDTQVIGGTPEDPFLSGPLGKVTLAAFFTPLARDHRGDFVGTHIDLHPGVIDRLW